MMKKTIALILAVVTLLAVCVFMVSCGKTGECDMCQQTAKLTEITYDGETGWYCSDCAELVEGLIELADAFS